MKCAVHQSRTSLLAAIGLFLATSAASAQSPSTLFDGLAPPAPDSAQSLKTEADDWYKDAVVYHLWVSAFRDSDGDGFGDLQGIIESLDTLKQLGVNTLWLSPFFESASSRRNLHGYDVTDHYQVDPRLGTNEAADELIREAHARGMRLIMDFVPNHLSNRHPWFVESRDPDSPKRDWFLWRDEQPEEGWTGFDRHSDWHELDGDYYYGIFWSGMPDVNHRNPEIRLELARAARHWLDRGFDGMRMDAVKYLYEDLDSDGARADLEDQPQTVAWFDAWRREVLDPYTDQGYAKFMVAENWVGDHEKLWTYLRHEDRPVFHMTLNFPLLSALTELDAPLARELWQWGAELPDTAWLGNFVSNHDLAADRPGTLFADEPEKLRAQTAWLLLGLGTPFLYYGNEIGQEQGRQRGDTRHRQPLDWDEVQRQQGDPESTWRWHQRLIQLRHEHASLRRGKAQFLPTNLEKVDLVAIWRETDGDATLTILSGSADATQDLVVSLPADSDPQSLQSVIRSDSIEIQEDGTLNLGALDPFETKVFARQRDGR